MKQALQIFGKSPFKVAGCLLLVAGVLILMGIITAETQYPQALHYDTYHNDISDLGATRPPNSIITQPSAAIFNVTMMVTGVMTIGAAVAMRKAYPGKWVGIGTGLMGLGILGVGVFPGNYPAVHPIFALLAFSSGGVSAMLSSRVAAKPFAYIALALGVIALASLFLNGWLAQALGGGGAERWIAYPVTLWMVAFGAYMLGVRTKSTD